MTASVQSKMVTNVSVGTTCGARIPTRLQGGMHTSVTAVHYCSFALPWASPRPKRSRQEREN